jgi:hypothetical protein
METLKSMKTAGAGLMPRRSALATGAKLNMAKHSSCRPARHVALNCQAVVAGDRPETSIAEKVSLSKLIHLHPSIFKLIFILKYLFIILIEISYMDKRIRIPTRHLRPRQRLACSSLALAGQPCPSLKHGKTHPTSMNSSSSLPVTILSTHLSYRPCVLEQ